MALMSSHAKIDSDRANGLTNLAERRGGDSWYLRGRGFGDAV